MTSIFNEGINILPQLIDEFNGMSNPLSKIRTPLRESMLHAGLIMDIPSAEGLTDNVSLATVDGADIVNQLAHVDMVVSGATIGEGYWYKSLYESEHEYPSVSHLDIVQHDAKNKDAARALMGVQELSLLSMINHDVRIVDGSWLSGATALYLTLSESVLGSKMIMDFLLRQRHHEGWDGFELTRSLEFVVTPWKMQDSEKPFDLIALTKSDSSRVLSRHVQKLLETESLRKTFDNLELLDRFIATLVLESGEMIKPLYIDAGRSLYPRMNASGLRAFNSIVRKYRQELTNWEKSFYKVASLSELPAEAKQERSAYISRLVSELTNSSDIDGNVVPLSERVKALDSDGGAWIWATYFKPRNFSNSHKALRMELSRDSQSIDREGDVSFDADTFSEEVAEKAARLISLVDIDVVGEEILEPWSQYIADRQAKTVSELAEYTRSSLIDSANDGFLTAGIINSYRT